MTEARVFIDMKEGIIELEGPIEFVEKYMAKYAPAGGKAAAEAVAPQTPRRRGRPAKAGQPGRKKKMSCAVIVNGMIDGGFFGEGRGFGAVKSEVLTQYPECSDNKIRKALKDAITGGKIAASGAGRGMKYARTEAA